MCMPSPRVGRGGEGAAGNDVGITSVISLQLRTFSAHGNNVVGDQKKALQWRRGGMERLRRGLWGGGEGERGSRHYFAPPSFW